MKLSSVLASLVLVALVVTLVVRPDIVFYLYLTIAGCCALVFAYEGLKYFFEWILGDLFDLW